MFKIVVFVLGLLVLLSLKFVIFKDIDLMYRDPRVKVRVEGKVVDGRLHRNWNRDSLVITYTVGGLAVSQWVYDNPGRRFISACGDWVAPDDWVFPQSSCLLQCFQLGKEDEPPRACKSTSTAQRISFCDKNGALVEALW